MLGRTAAAVWVARHGCEEPRCRGLVHRIMSLQHLHPRAYICQSLAPAEYNPRAAQMCCTLLLLLTLQLKAGAGHNR